MSDLTPHPTDPTTGGTWQHGMNPTATVELLPPDTPVMTATGRVGIVQEPGAWNAIALPLYRLVLLEGLERPYWFGLQTLKIRA